MYEEQGAGTYMYVRTPYPQINIKWKPHDINPRPFLTLFSKTYVHVQHHAKIFSQFHFPFLTSHPHCVTISRRHHLTTSSLFLWGISEILYGVPSTDNSNSTETLGITPPNQAYPPLGPRIVSFGLHQLLKVYALWPFPFEKSIMQ